MYLLLYFLFSVFFCVVNSHKMCSNVQSSFSKMKLVKILLCTQLKQTWEIIFIFQQKVQKKSFNDTAFQHFVDEFKHSNLDRRIDLQLLVLVLVFLCLYSIYLTIMFFFHNMFCFIYFFSMWVCNILVTCYKICLQFLMKIFYNKLFAFVLFSIIHDSLDYI